MSKFCNESLPFRCGLVFKLLCKTEGEKLLNKYNINLKKHILQKQNLQTYPLCVLNTQHTTFETLTYFNIFINLNRYNFYNTISKILNQPIELFLLLSNKNETTHNCTISPFVKNSIDTNQQLLHMNNNLERLVCWKILSYLIGRFKQITYLVTNSTATQFHLYIDKNIYPLVIFIFIDNKFIYVDTIYKK